MKDTYKSILYKSILFTLFFWQNCHSLSGTSFWINNQTPLELRLEPSFDWCNKAPDCRIMHGKHYAIHNKVAKPWCRTKVLKLDRYPPLRLKHIKFKIVVTPYLNGKRVGNSIILFQQLNLEGLNIRASVDDNILKLGFRETGWKQPDGRKIGIHTSWFDKLTDDNQGAQSVFDSVEYAFLPMYYPKASWDPNPKILRVLQYNVWMRSWPIFILEGQEERAKTIPGMITRTFKDYAPDIVCFNEVFEKKAKAAIIQAMKYEGYGYNTEVLNSGPEMRGGVSALWQAFRRYAAGVKSVKMTSGGVMIFSRWPIEKTAEMMFENHSGEDSAAQKGVLYVKINKKGKKYNIFATHTNAGSGKKTEVAVEEKYKHLFPQKPIKLNTRGRQELEMRRFIDAQNIPTTEPIIIAGDFNVNRRTLPRIPKKPWPLVPRAKDPKKQKWSIYDSYKRMIQTLDVKQPKSIGNEVTHDNFRNMLATGGWFDLEKHLNTPYEKRPEAGHYFDYVFYKKSHRNPIKSYNKVLVPKLNVPWVDGEVLSLFKKFPAFVAENRSQLKKHSGLTAKGKTLETRKRQYLFRTGHPDTGDATFHCYFPYRWEPSDHQPVLGYFDFTKSKQEVEIEKKIETKEKEIQKKKISKEEIEKLKKKTEEQKKQTEEKLKQLQQTKKTRESAIKRIEISAKGPTKATIKAKKEIVNLEKKIKNEKQQIKLLVKKIKTEQEKINKITKEIADLKSKTITLKTKLNQTKKGW